VCSLTVTRASTDSLLLPFLIDDVLTQIGADGLRPRQRIAAFLPMLATGAQERCNQNSYSGCMGRVARRRKTPGLLRRTPWLSGSGT